MRIKVIDPDSAMCRLLTAFLGRFYSHIETGSLPDCPLHRDASSCCGRPQACADVVMTTIKFPIEENLLFLVEPRRRGCKVHPANKMVISAGMTPAQEEVIRNFGAEPLRKPFRLSEILGYLQDCSARLA
ncbi:MAG: hypothetical protein C0616_12335 [Desulfuromonas sp.]|nr:MAG: hypothetical protein C0616_12335 [Desulfuromonas sp.]